MKILEFLDKGWFKTLLQITQLSLTIFAVWFSYTTAKRGAESNARNLKIFQSMAAADSSINEVTKGILTNLQSIPGASESFKAGIEKLGKTMEKQSDNFKNSIAALEHGVTNFTSSLQRQENAINSVASVTEKSVQVLGKRTELLEQELSRSPKLNLTARKVVRDTTGTIDVDTWLVNSGNIFSSKQTILIRIPKDYHFTSSGYKVSDPEEQEQVWSLQLDRFVGYDKSGQPSMMVNIPAMNFKLTLAPTIKSLKIPYKIFHEGGITEDYLTVNVPK